MKEDEGNQQQQEEVDDDKDANSLDGGVQVGLEVWQPELRRVPTVHNVGGVGDDADGHGDGVEGDGDATVVDITVPEARSPTTFNMHFLSLK